VPYSAATLEPVKNVTAALRAIAANTELYRLAAAYQDAGWPWNDCDVSFTLLRL